MYKAYFKDYSIFFDTKLDNINENFYTLSLKEERNFPTRDEFLNLLATHKHVAVIAENPERIFAEFCGLFTMVYAGGGIVTSPEGDLLMIHRNGRWDLAKGKNEYGESMEQTSRREVAEETGVEPSELGRFVDYTYHIYNDPYTGQLLLKRTSWYRMYANKNAELLGQEEEGITMVEWVSEQDIAYKARKSYYTIQDILSKAGYNIALR